MLCTLPLAGILVSAPCPLQLISVTASWITTWFLHGKLFSGYGQFFFLMFLQSRHITKSYLDVTRSQGLKFCQESSFLKKKRCFSLIKYITCVSDTHSSTICAIPLHAHQLFRCANIQNQHQTEQARSLLHTSCLDGWKQSGWPWYSGLSHFQMVLVKMILLLKCEAQLPRHNYMFWTILQYKPGLHTRFMWQGLPAVIHFVFCFVLYERTRCFNWFSVNHVYLNNIVAQHFFNILIKYIIINRNHRLSEISWCSHTICQSDILSARILCIHYIFR